MGSFAPNLKANTAVYNKLQKLLLTILTVLCVSPVWGYNITVDKNGVMRRSDNGAEVSFYGANYTVPFAHAYRALESLGIDHKRAIDRDVYHFSRLGLDAFRIHVWDVEIADAQGNIIENEHLDLLDYLIYKMEERGISVVLTAQTNFGNGYPEKNIDTGAFTYDFPKCGIHDDPRAIAIQERYLKAFAGHKNRYTGKTYAGDDRIIAIEINNEPCHNGDARAAKDYVNRMVKALRSGGFKKPIFYNVSHNMHCTEGLFEADIQGTTYQWYPMGLVAGHERKGNYLPYVETYNIPFADVKNFDKRARMIYEFDPADNLYTFLYPAAVRTFRKAGFQWMTQFAYDPTDMAWSNTEYQTHFLNLAYTPGKAIGMKIASMAAHEIERGADYGAYPADTVFGNFRVSYNQNLSEYNSDDKFFYTNNTATAPRNLQALTQVAGVGSSPVVKYAGSGAYFLDRLDANTWRLEVMPDVVLTCDPFEKPSLKRRVGEIMYCEEHIEINLPSLGANFGYKSVNEGNNRKGQAVDGEFNVYPGVYLLTAAGTTTSWTADSQYGSIRVGEFVAPGQRPVPVKVVHTPLRYVADDGELCIRATVTGNVDSVVVYPSDVSFWNETNVVYKMKRCGSHEYQANVKIDKGKKDFRYNVVAFAGGEAVTYPGNIEGTPLDWDFLGAGSYSVKVCNAGSPIVLLAANENWDGMGISSIPDGQRYSCSYSCNEPMAADSYDIRVSASTDTAEVVVSKYVGDIIAPISDLLKGRKLYMAMTVGDGPCSVKLALVTKLGATYSCRAELANGMAVADISDFRPDVTRISPQPFPMFLSRKVAVQGAPALELKDVERVEVILGGMKPGTDCRVSLSGIWLE